MKIFLDDVRNPHEVHDDGGKWITCRDVEQVKMWLQKRNIVTHLSLDGDMGKVGERDIPGGVELIDWMREFKLFPTEKIFIHSRNDNKRQAMVNTLARCWKGEVEVL